MKKELLLEFISKYYLNGVIEKCRWVSSSKDKTLKVSVKSEDKGLLAMVTLKNWDGFGDAELGIGDTKKFKTELLGLVDEDVTFELLKSEDNTNFTRIDIFDSATTMNYPTSDLDVIAQSSYMKVQPTYNAEIVFDADFRERFLKAKASLPNVDYFTVMMNKKDILEFVIGYSNINNSRKSFSKLKTNPGKNRVSDIMHFNAVYLKEIFTANSECQSTILNISDMGVAYLEFLTDNFSCQYYLAPVNQD